MMAKMRSLAPAFIIIVGVLFVLFMVVSDSSILENFGGAPTNVGSINGEDISYKEFSKILNQQRENRKNQTGKDIADENLNQFRDEIWDAVVTQTFFAQEIKKLNITIADDEIKDVILSDNPPEFLRQNFIDSTGKFNKDLYQSALFDPQNKQALIQAEDFVRQTLLTQKLQSMLLASINVSESEIKRQFIEQKTTMNIQYTLFPFTDFSDSSITITDVELKKYYNENINKYKIPSKRRLKYVLFPIISSSGDSAFALRNISVAIKDFQKDPTNFKKDVEIFSSTPYSLDTLNISLFPANATAITKAKAGALVGPIPTPGGLTLYHLIKTLPSKNTVVRASHILINQFGDDKKNKTEAMKLYNRLKKGANFEKLAKEKSADPGSAVKGGDLGWFAKGRMVKSFEKAVFNGRINQVQKPVKTNFGYHIIKVTGKSNRLYVVEKIFSEIKASAATKDEIKNKAGDYAYLSNKNGFESEAKLVDYKIQETSLFSMSKFGIPGLGVNKRLMDFAFNNDLNSISDAFTLSNGFVVVKILEIKNKSIQPFEQVKAAVTQLIKTKYKVKLARQKALDIKSKINGDLSKVINYDKNSFVSTLNDITPNRSIPGIGKDYAFIEGALNAKVNELTDPINGKRGIYLIKVLSRTPFDSSAFAIQKNTIRDNILNKKKRTFIKDWITLKKEKGDIVDNRYFFYGQ
ncbi:MAG: peptidylprolyl isomerase [Bacteroidetes bacterium]|nr:peptidylprolyl isomerase [Bacteroidota bacterium]